MNINKNFSPDNNVSGNCIDRKYPELSESRTYESFPEKTAVVLPLPRIYLQESKIFYKDCISIRMVGMAGHLPNDEFIGLQMNVPTDGQVKMSAFSSGAVQASDLEWAVEEMIALPGTDSYPETEHITEGNLYEMCLSVSKKTDTVRSIGFFANSTNPPVEGESDLQKGSWPLYFPCEFDEFVKALRVNGGIFRFMVGSSTDEEQAKTMKEMLPTWDNFRVNIKEYCGAPVRVKAMLLLPGEPSARLLSMLGNSISLKALGDISDSSCLEIWDNFNTGYKVLPEKAAQALMADPIVTDMYSIGVDVCRKPARPLPACYDDPAEDSASVKIGTAMAPSGVSRDILLPYRDLNRHWQIIGQTGTGKSTLLAETLVNVIKDGHGLTFFDPHGTTIDLILRMVPKEYASRIRVIRIGDEANPVPINMWNSDDPYACEKTISDMNLLFSEIFDPRKEGFIGPRWERWFSTFSKAAIAAFGKLASFEVISVISQNKDNMERLCYKINDRYPEIAEIVKNEYLNDYGRDCVSTLSWYICKMQRLTSVPQLRNTLGAGENVLDFEHVIDTDQVTLIDLASPTIGMHAARITGTMILMQLWNAVMARKKRDRMHIIAVDEAHLFQTNPLPQMLAEGRKFGIGMIIAHQHCGQLSREIREALDANAANFSAFRLSYRDATEASVKFQTSDAMHANLINDLCRLDAFRAITTLAVRGRQTDAFTLFVKKPVEESNGARIAANIEEESIRTLVDPYRSCRALTSKDILRFLNSDKSTAQTNVQKPTANSSSAGSNGQRCTPDEKKSSSVGHEHIDWLDEWNKSRKGA